MPAPIYNYFDLVMMALQVFVPYHIGRFVMVSLPPFDVIAFS
jgi:hypothetical protein